MLQRHVIEIWGGQSEPKYWILGEETWLGCAACQLQLGAGGAKGLTGGQ